MARAVELSRLGFPAPNPYVGCVITDGPEVVGEGFHAYAGGPHAEVVALDQAGTRARGATAFVTLEPCNHTGRTGPCSEALIAAGVSRVVSAVRDPNPRAQGGLERLQAAGLETETGMLEQEAEAANRAWLTAVRRQSPFLTLKAAVSLDGRIALPDGSSKWITSEQARQEAHRLRAQHAAVMVGRRTVELDDPQLTVRIDGVVNQPVRVVLDLQAKLPRSYRVFDSSAPSLHITADWLAGRSITQALWDEGLNTVLVEGGGTTHSRLLAEGLGDRIELFVAPKVLGAGPAWVEGELSGALTLPAGFRWAETRSIGPDLWLSLDRNPTRANASQQ